MMSGNSVIDEVVKELTIISYIEQEQKIATTTGVITIYDDTPQTSVSRWFNGESRTQNVTDIENLVRKTEEIVVDLMGSNCLSIYETSSEPTLTEKADYRSKYRALELLADKLENAIRGITNLKKTYYEDKPTVSSLDIMIKNVERITECIRTELERLEQEATKHQSNSNLRNRS